jgi:iron complex transport system permease protein
LAQARSVSAGGLAAKLAVVDTRWKMAALVSLPVLAFILSFPLGRYPIPLDQLVTIIAAKVFPIAHTWPDSLETVVFNVRLPRIVAAMLVGGALSTAGASYQGMFKNPLVSPDILGASAGAGFGAALAILFSFGILGIQAMAFVFGLGAVFLAYTISQKIRHDPVLVLVLAGILIGTLFTSGTSLVKFSVDTYQKLPQITFWLMGSLAATAPRDVYVAIGPVLVGLVPLYLLRWRLNVLAQPEEEARSLGLDTGRIRLIVIVASTLATAAAVAISGLVGWVGLVIPHLARMIVGPNYKALIPASLILGSTYLLLVDDLARVVGTVEIPLGILTSMIGAPFFLFLLLRARRIWI